VKSIYSRLSITVYNYTIISCIHFDMERNVNVCVSSFSALTLLVGSFDP